MWSESLSTFKINAAFQPQIDVLYATHTHTHSGWLLLYLVCKAPHCWSANEHTLGSQGKRFQYITSCPDSTVQVDLDPTLHCVHDLWQCVNLLVRDEDTAKPVYFIATVHNLISVWHFTLSWTILSHTKQHFTIVFRKRVTKARMLTNSHYLKPMTCWCYQQGLSMSNANVTTSTTANFKEIVLQFEKYALFAFLLSVKWENRNHSYICLLTIKLEQGDV